MAIGRLPEEPQRPKNTDCLTEMISIINNPCYQKNKKTHITDAIAECDKVP